MPKKKSGPIYEVRVTKLGSAQPWSLGDLIDASEFPDTDFERLVANGSVRLVDGGSTDDTTPKTETILQSAAPIPSDAPDVLKLNPPNATNPA